MTRTLPYLLLLGCWFSSNVLFAQSAPWDIKKQRNQSTQAPTFEYRTINGAKKQSARVTNFPAKAKGILPSSNLRVQGGTSQEPPREIRGVLPPVANQAARVSNDLPAAANFYLRGVADLMQINDPTLEFVPKQQWQDTQSAQHLRLQQQYQGVEIYGSEIIVHADQLVVQGLNGRYLATPQALNTIPSVTSSEATQVALSQFESIISFSEEQKQLLQYSGPETKLVILPTWVAAGQPQLAWQVMARPDMLDYWEIFIDAQTGKLIQKTNLTCSFVPEMYLPDSEADLHHHHHTTSSHTTTSSPLRLSSASRGSGFDLNNRDQELNIWRASDGFGLIDASKDMYRSPAGTAIQDLEGVVITYDALSEPKPESVSIVTSTNGVFTDPAAVSAHYNASIAYDYFRQRHGRLAINGTGGNVLSIVNYVEDDGSGMDNAFWNGTFMVYGNGDVGFKPLAGALDVGGHEMSHGVIGTTANLIYRNQSGAINEHIADVFGVLIEGENYLLGEDVVSRDVFASGALRDMEDPHNGGTSLGDRGWQPDHMLEIYTGDQDNGGVHINSGILNRAFFLLASEIGRERAGDLYYHALTNYLTASSEFIDLRRALLNSSNDLFGSVEGQAVVAAFDAVGISQEIVDNEPGDEEEEDELPTIAGSEFLLTVNTDGDDRNDSGEINSLYLVDLENESFKPISTSTVQRKPTVTDDGSTAFFITEDETIHGIELSEPYEEIIISDTSFWSNISISKDGNRFAVISNQKLPEIWVFDLTRESDNLVRFELYNPTTQEGVTTGEVQYADAIEWDYSGEYLIYDAFNQVQSFGFAESIEYWDVGYLKVWDNTANDFGDGTIQKIFTNLPAGTNIGNPSFAKTNRNIVCFDLFNAEEDTYQIIATNLSTGKTNVVYENNTLGFPSYSSDDQFMVFDVIDDEDRPAVGQISLNEDKISSTGELNTTYYYAQWTSWFSQGDRIINSSEKNLLDYDIAVGGTTIAATITSDSVLLTLPEGTDLNSLVARFTKSPNSQVYVGEFLQLSGVSSNEFSKVIDYTVVAQDGSTRVYHVAAKVENSNNPEPEPEPVPDPVTSIGNQPETEAAVVYPNPFEQELYLSRVLPKNCQINLSDVLGRSYNTVINQKKVIVPQSLKPGVYFLTIQTPNYTRTVRLLRK
ncbi:MAG: M4 family metallopeptidase [Tunicatimonas sp.]|uniref:M4 family metallopeptidase n=1 Tax=Tunicatimonas sp. TaxID=1940096 RepID=UPI003C7257F5